MATTIRPELSMKNKYWIDKHRYYELKHFCLQYPEWKKSYFDMDGTTVSAIVGKSSDNIPPDPTARQAVTMAHYSKRMDIIERAARKADAELYSYILQAVTEGLSYTYLKSKLNIPCGKDMYYDRYRRFFWILSNERD